MSRFENKICYLTIVLRVLVSGPKRRGELEKIFIRESGSRHSFDSLMRYAVKKGYIVKMGPPGSRAPYKLTDRVHINDSGKISIKI